MIDKIVLQAEHVCGTEPHTPGEVSVNNKTHTADGTHWTDTIGMKLYYNYSYCSTIAGWGTVCAEGHVFIQPNTWLSFGRSDGKLHIVRHHEHRGQTTTIKVPISSCYESKVSYNRMKRTGCP